MALTSFINSTHSDRKPGKEFSSGHLLGCLIASTYFDSSGPAGEKSLSRCSSGFYKTWLTDLKSLVSIRITWIHVFKARRDVTTDRTSVLVKGTLRCGGDMPVNIHALAMSHTLQYLRRQCKRLPIPIQHLLYLILSD